MTSAQFSFVQHFLILCDVSKMSNRIHLHLINKSYTNLSLEYSIVLFSFSRSSSVQGTKNQNATGGEKPFRLERGLNTWIGRNTSAGKVKELDRLRGDIKGDCSELGGERKRLILKATRLWGIIIVMRISAIWKHHNWINFKIVLKSGRKKHNHHHFCWLVSMVTGGETFPRDRLILPCFLLPTQPDIVNIFR